MTDTAESVLRSAVAAPPPELVDWAEIERRASRTRRSRRRIALLAAVGALAVAALLLVGGVGRDGRPSELERARAALSAPWPAGEILHQQQRMVSHFDQPAAVVDSWQLTSAPYTKRTVSLFEDGKASDRLEMMSAADGHGQLYDWRSNTVAETDGVGPDWQPTGVDQSTRSEMLAWLDREHPESLGPSVVDGHPVVGFELTGPQGRGTDRVFLDAATYLPVMTQSFGWGTGELAKGYDEHYRWELLPDTEANRALLDVAALHTDATVEPSDAAAWRARATELGRLFRTTIVPGI